MHAFPGGLCQSGLGGEGFRAASGGDNDGERHCGALARRDTVLNVEAGDGFDERLGVGAGVFSLSGGVSLLLSLLRGFMIATS